MSLDYAILGFLYEKPMSGYELKKTFDTSVQHFWPADQSQIYKTLANLNKAGWVDLRIETHDDRPNSKVYSITDEGKNALREWMGKALPPIEPRMPWLIQLFFAGTLPDEAVLDLLRQFEDNLHEQYDFLGEMIEENLRNGWPDSRVEFYKSLTADFAYTMFGALVDWTVRTKARVEAGEQFVENPKPMN